MEWMELHCEKFLTDAVPINSYELRNNRDERKGRYMKSKIIGILGMTAILGGCAGQPRQFSM
jgi:hypothetical protein